MTTNDQPHTIPADKVREITEKMYDHADHDNVRGSEEEYVLFFARQLAKLLPQRPTLADMPPEERAACRRMQADVENRSERYVIINPCDAEGDAALTSADGGIEWFSPMRVTPRPDLPRLEWPAPTAPAPALPGDWRPADHQRIGRVIVTNPTPNPGGHVYFVTSDDNDPRGSVWGFCNPNELTYIDADQEADTPDAVPPNTLDAGSEWGDADALARACEESGRDQIIALDRAGDAYVWVEAFEWWEGVGPLSVNAPFTIIHDGKKADQ